MKELLYIILIVGALVALALGAVLIIALRRSMSVAKLYAARGRDLRFVCALLRYYLPGGKWRILRNPCLLSDDKGAPPRADLLIIGGGGVLILTVDERTGRFSTPPTGDWTHWQEGAGSHRVPNRFTEGRQYTATVNGLLVRAGISCPVINLIVMSDDHVTADDLYAENVMTCDQLVPYVKRFCKRGMLKSATQKRLRDLLVAHHVKCKKALEKAAAEESTAPAGHERFTAADLFSNIPVAEVSSLGGQSLICPHCGAGLPTDSRFCNQCGQSLVSGKESQ